jgi:hypothetical protein
MSGVGRLEIPPFEAEQGTPHSGLHRMERAVNADRAEPELFGCPREVTRLHEREDDLEVAKGDLFVDSGKHDPDHRVTNGDPRWMLARANERGQQRDRRPNP